MAHLEFIAYTAMQPKIERSGVHWLQLGPASDKGLPQVFWSDGAPWREVNAWALERFSTCEVKIATVQSNLSALHAYANWLEKTNTNWLEFPTRKAERCLTKYRKHLIIARDDGRIAPSTATQRMLAVIQFYRWAANCGAVETDVPPWKEKHKALKFFDTVGFSRTISVSSSDLTIPNRSNPNGKLEDGLLPISIEERNALIKMAGSFSSIEFTLMLKLGFFTGMRLGTACDLRVETVQNAALDSQTSDLYRLAVGPAARPPVHTKNGVSGTIWIPAALRDELLEYASSARRYRREARAEPSNKNLVFITRLGNSYHRKGSEKSSAINVEMHKIRALAKNSKHTGLSDFHFHQSRCTFATELAKSAIAAGGPIAAIAIIKEALLHKHESTSLRYVRFIEKTPAKIELSNSYTKSFLGLLDRQSGGSN